MLARVEAFVRFQREDEWHKLALVECYRAGPPTPIYNSNGKRIRDDDGDSRHKIVWEGAYDKGGRYVRVENFFHWKGFIEANSIKEKVVEAKDGDEFIFIPYTKRSGFR